jgi:hypothetical protein
MTQSGRWGSITRFGRLFLSHLGTELLLMELPSGVYTIENVHNRNWAILANDNDGDDVLSGTDADESAGHKVRSL